MLLFNRGFYRFLYAVTQDHTDVLLFNRGFSRFSDDTPTFSCYFLPLHRTTQMYHVSVMILLRFLVFLPITQDHTDVLLFNRGFSRFSDDTPTFS